MREGYSQQLGLLGLIAERGGFDGGGGQGERVRILVAGEDARGGFGEVVSPCDPGGKGDKIVTEEFVAIAAAQLQGGGRDWLTGDAPFTAKKVPGIRALCRIRPADAAGRMVWARRPEGGGVSGGSAGALKPLTPDQASGSDPEAHVWLAASAGTGKTQVLAARVFRLLLRGVEPGAILCLTFTKAGAAEMAGRISDRLARWVRMPRAELQQDLFALGETVTPELVEAARTLFAKVLDAPGGGLRIQTIHGFCQGLLAAFPVEAGLTPGSGRWRRARKRCCAREALAGMLADAEAEGRSRPEMVDRRAVAAAGRGRGGGVPVRLRARAARRWTRCRPGSSRGCGGSWTCRRATSPRMWRARCDEFDCDALGEMAALNRAWGTARGVSAGGRDRAHGSRVRRARRGRPGSMRSRKLWSVAKGWAPQDEGYAEQATGMRDECAELASLLLRGVYADLLADALEVGRDYARAYAAAKRRVGAVDFDDLIGTTVRLLQQPGIGEWVQIQAGPDHQPHPDRRGAGHQCCNQWTIVDALANEFFVGRGTHAPDSRTLFTVGDYKQAIYGFQGTEPALFPLGAGQVRDGGARGGGRRQTGRCTSAGCRCTSCRSCSRSARRGRCSSSSTRRCAVLPEPGHGR